MKSSIWVTLLFLVAYLLSAFTIIHQDHTIAQQKQLIRQLWSDCK